MRVPSAVPEHFSAIPAAPRVPLRGGDLESEIVCQGECGVAGQYLTGQLLMPAARQWAISFSSRRWPSPWPWLSERTTMANWRGGARRPRRREPRRGCAVRRGFGGDEGDFACLVDVRIAHQLGVVEVAQQAEEAEMDVFRAQARGRRVPPRPRTDRSQRDTPPIEQLCLPPARRPVPVLVHRVAANAARGLGDSSIG